MRSKLKLTPPLKYHGGKHYLAPSIIDLMPPHVTYAEPFFGGGSVLLAKDPEGVNEIVNDINQSLMQFWHVMRSPDLFEAFLRRVQSTPFGPHIWELVNKTNPYATEELFGKSIPSFTNLITYVTSCFVLWRQSLAGRGDAPAPLSTSRLRRGMNEQVSAWMTCLEGLPEVHARMMRLALCCEDFEKFIERCDTKDTLFYCDPPYLHETRTTTKNYEHEMDNKDHIRLLDCLVGIKGKFILSGYRSKLYDGYAKKHDWTLKQIIIPNNAAAGKTKRRMTECLYMNYTPPVKAS